MEADKGWRWTMCLSWKNSLRLRHRSASLSRLPLSLADRIQLISAYRAGIVSHQSFDLPGTYHCSPWTELIFVNYLWGEKQQNYERLVRRAASYFTCNDLSSHHGSMGRTSHVSCVSYIRLERLSTCIRLSVLIWALMFGGPVHIVCFDLTPYAWRSSSYLSVSPVLADHPWVKAWAVRSSPALSFYCSLMETLVGPFIT